MSTLKENLIINAPPCPEWYEPEGFEIKYGFPEPKDLVGEEIAGHLLIREQLERFIASRVMTALSSRNRWADITAPNWKPLLPEEPRTVEKAEREFASRSSDWMDSVRNERIAFEMARMSSWPVSFADSVIARIGE